MKKLSIIIRCLLGEVLLYFIPRKRTDFGKKSFSFVGPKVWQIVPNELKLLTFSQIQTETKVSLANILLLKLK